MAHLQLIPEFIEALKKEIDAIKKGKGGSIVKVFNGRFLRETGGFFIYVFNLENFLVAMDDTPAEIEISGIKYQCQIVSIQNPEIEIAIERNLGNYIAEAKVQTNLWFLLEILRKKFEESAFDTTKFKMSEKLFSGESQVLNKDISQIKYSVLPNKIPNESQKKAITLSFNNSLAIIWGPPGTGKTTTIAQAIEAHINTGRKVLLVSHANTAVDQALKDVAEHLKDSLYQEGKLVRLGICHLQELQDNYPLVILDRIAENLAQTLVQEKIKLITECDQLEILLNELEVINTQNDQLQRLDMEKQAIEGSLIDFSKRLAKVNHDLQQNRTQYEFNRDKFDKAKQAGTLKRIFLGLDPVKIQQKIDQLNAIIDTNQRKAFELEQRINEVQQNLFSKENEFNNLKHEIKNRLAKHNLTLESFKNQWDNFKKRLEVILSRISEINNQIEGIQKQVLSEAKLVATTLTKTFSSRQFPETPFDVLIIDECSMAPLPYMYWAASKANIAVTIVGDFKQLPPICVSEDPIAKKWLGRSIFDVLGINTVQGALNDQRVALLKTQYRMAPEIADVSNRLIYGGALENHPNTKNLVLDDDISGTHKLVVVNTSEINPWCNHLSTGGRFNIYHALVSASLAKKLLQEVGEELKIGIISPYRAQARLISKIIDDWGFTNKVRIDTIHRFQGGEEDVIIFDCVEGPGLKTNWSMLDESHNSQADLLLNVALTRAKKKVYLVAYCKHLYSLSSKNSIILRVLKCFYETGCEIPSEKLIVNYVAADFEKWATKAMGPNLDYSFFDSTLYTEKNFWPVFIHDLINTFNSLIIMSPFISLNRTGKMMDFFRALVQRGITIKIYTRPASQQGGYLSEHAKQAIDQFESIGITVIQRTGMHQKIAIIDNRIVWEGSLNILSHQDTQEQMRRIEGEKTVKEIITNLELDMENSIGDVTKDLCPKCLEKGIESRLIIRRSRFGTFMGCSRYPACKYTVNFKKQSHEKIGKK